MRLFLVDFQTLCCLAFFFCHFFFLQSRLENISSFNTFVISSPRSQFFLWHEKVVWALFETKTSGTVSKIRARWDENQVFIQLLKTTQSIFKKAKVFSNLSFGIVATSKKPRREIE